ncbi:MAG TPA: LuxR C-terminal-related transcriptional regulator, partial [Pseudomonas sp.]|nr:LuxR C-terminal-related transcriptional regulator [Pseudomonas sp.]
DQIQGRVEQSSKRLAELEEYARQTGAGLLCLNAMSQHMLLLLNTPDRARADPLLERSLQAAAGGALLPLQGLIRKHPDWLRERLLKRPLCRLVEYLLDHLPPSPGKESPSVRDPLDPAACHGSDSLSARELGVLQLIAQGCSNQEISERLFISLHTVKTHASHINSKLGVERRTQAVARAQELGLLG